ncbi:hypothetical protein MUG87_07795 [Ectobacillus sp. JY-23]|uniref:hypothetical protein n=1 Tax=Ectobacillus sp. JY-23 TaxID=2933872 RepID=UPI001FF53DAA|nr:hypothetical protein [Ectobacillus sp. JY-23]UOY94000.1 hypothetical protein MUG87_07795 [Ectobacillus sp. JY-23]
MHSSIAQQSETKEMKQELEKYLNQGYSMEAAFALLEARCFLEYEKMENPENTARWYIPLAALQIEYGVLQEGVKETTLSLLQQNGGSTFEAHVTDGLKATLRSI